MDDKTGGQAFPKMMASVNHADGTVSFGTEGGMTMRAYFAAKAMKGDMASQEPNVFMLNHCITDEELSAVCRHWYRIADAMIEAGK